MKADGTIWIDTKIDESGMEDGFNRMRDGADDVAVSFRNAGKVIEKSFSNINFNKTIENLKAQIRSLEDEFASVSREFEDAVKFDDDKAAEKLGAKRAKIYDRIARLREKLAVEVAAAASKEAAAEENASRRVVAAEEKEAAKRKQLNNDLVNAGNSASYFGNRLRGIVSSALVFNVISSGLRKVTSYFGTALMANNQFASAVASLKMSLRTAFQPIYEAMLPALTTLVNWLNVAVQAVGRFFAALAGKSYKTMQKNAQSLGSAIESAGSSSETVKDTTDAVGNMGNALEDTGQKAKEAEKYLAGFDEINRMIEPAEDLSSNVSSNMSGNVPTIPNNAIGEVQLGEITTEDFGFEDKISPKIEAIVQKIKELIEPLKNIDLSPLKEAFNRFKEALQPITRNLFDGLEWAWHNLLVPLASWTIQDFIPAFLNLLSAALQFLNTVIEGIKPLAEWLWTSFLQPLAEWTGGVIVDVINLISEALTKISDWISQHQEAVNNFIAMILSIVAAYEVVTTLTSIGEAIKTVIQFISGANLVLMPLITTIVGWITKIGTFFVTVGAKISSLLSVIGSALSYVASVLGVSVGWVAAIVAAIAAAVAAIFVYWDELVLWAQYVGESLKQVWQSILDWIEDVRAKYDELKAKIIKWSQETANAINEHFIAPIREWFDELMKKIREWFDGAKENIKEAFQKAGEYIENNFISPVKKWIQNLKDTISNIFENIKEKIISTITAAAKEIQTKFIDPIGEKFEKLREKITDAFRKAHDKIKEIFGSLKQWFSENVLDPIWKAFDNVVDKVIEGLNRLAREISSLLTGSNRRVTTTTTKNTYTTVSSMYPEPPAIPMLARGAVIPPNQKFLAVLGDQKHGTNIEAPLETIQEAVAMVMADIVPAMIAGFEAVVNEQIATREAVENIDIDGATLYNYLSGYRRKMAVTNGSPLPW